MSAYLTSVVRRSLAPDLSIRPRLSSMFDAPEQGFGWGAPTFEQSAEAEMRADVARAGDAGDPIEAIVVPDRRAQSARALSRPAASAPAGPDDGADRQQQARAPVRQHSTPAARYAPEPTAADERRHDVVDAGAPADTALVQRDRQERDIEKQSGELRDPEPTRAARGALQGSQVSRGRLQRKAVALAQEARSASPTLHDQPATARASQADGARETQAERSNATPQQSSEAPRSVPTRREAQLAAAHRILRADLGRRLPQAPRQEPDAPREAEDADSTEPQSVSARFPASKPAAQNPVRQHRAMPSSPFAQGANRARETADRSEAPKPEPTIEVTIGRIEVRAATTAAPSRKHSPPTGAPSLEDFLRGRPGQSIR